MYSNIIENRYSKAIFWTILSSAVALLIVAFSAMSSGANASPLVATKGAEAPPPAPTQPGTLPPASPTTQPNASVTVVPSSPTVPGPVPTGEVTPGACTISFSDVESGAWYYNYVMWMACTGIVNGYPDGTFRPSNEATRAQIVKIVVGAFHLPINTTNGPTYADVAVGSTFYDWIETASHNGLIVGYPCGGAGEPCNATNQPYFRPNNNVTRAQLTKIIVLGAQQSNPLGWALQNPAQATFADVAPGSTFYQYVETAVAHNVIAGYDCGGAGEPCPGRYFRPNGTATRAQLSKMVFEALAR